MSQPPLPRPDEDRPEIDWNADWSVTRAHWPALFQELGLVGKPGLRFLEIGSFEGQSALHLLEHVLTHPQSTLDLIDPLEFSEINDEDQRVRLERHLAPYLLNEQAEIHQGYSEAVLRSWADGRRDAFYDLIYIDGDHFPGGVMRDIVLSWPLLKAGGHMLFDDYVWLLGGHDGPKQAIDPFVKWYEPWILRAEQVGVDQYLVQKLS